jgi:hypothetical protein
MNLEIVNISLPLNPYQCAGFGFDGGGSLFRGFLRWMHHFYVGCATFVLSVVRFFVVERYKRKGKEVRCEEKLFFAVCSMKIGQ